LTDKPALAHCAEPKYVDAITVAISVSGVVALLHERRVAMISCDDLRPARASTEGRGGGDKLCEMLEGFTSKTAE
jgi:hypothetical protein